MSKTACDGRGWFCSCGSTDPATVAQHRALTMRFTWLILISLTLTALAIALVLRLVL